jgi:hypothetical protein
MILATPVTEADRVAKFLVNIFEKRGEALSLIRNVVREEVSEASKSLFIPIIYENNEFASIEELSTLFRANSMATKLMNCYVQYVGKRYTEAHFAPIVKQIIKESQDHKGKKGRPGSHLEVSNSMISLSFLILLSV